MDKHTEGFNWMMGELKRVSNPIGLIAVVRDRQANSMPGDGRELISQREFNAGAMVACSRWETGYRD